MKRKIFLTILITFTLFAFGAVCASAATDGFLTYSVSYGEATITYCDTSATGELVIPNTLGGYPVTSIGDYAFEYCSGLTCITIPDSVTSIGDSAFSGCDGLTSVTIPDSVTSIGDSAFSGCDGLTSVTIPDSVTSIGDFAFSGCSGLTSVTIPDSVTSIGDSAFDWCSGLTSVTIPDSVTSIGDSAFYWCSGLTRITIPDSVTSIGDSAFSDCDGLTSVTIPDSVTSIGDSAFSGCSGLTSVTIPDSVTSIGNYAFGYCSGLTCITIPDSVTSIGDSAFYWCSGLTSVTVGKGVEIIPENAFYDCESLKYVYLSAELLYVRSAAFDGCANIENVFYSGREEWWGSILFYNRNENLTNAKIIYNAEKKTYSFVTNCDVTLPDVTDYAIFNEPIIEKEGITMNGWYDNEDLSGDPIVFPYYGTATTLYAACTDRTGTSYEDALIAKENKSYTVTTTKSGQLVYYEFVPKKTKEYRIYSTGSKDTYGYLYNSKKSRLTYDNNSGDEKNFFVSYNLTAGETYYIAAKLYSGTGTFTLVIEETVDYKINEVKITDKSGNTLESIPRGSFLALVSFTNVSSNEDTVIVLGQYSENNEFCGLMYVKTKDVPAGSTIELMLPVDNTSGNVAKLKAFCWESLGSMTPMGDAVSFPKN